MVLKIRYLEFSDRIEEKNLCICLGFFDGMHQAHTALVKQAVKVGKAKGLKVAMFTFSMNVLNFIRNKKHQCLTSIEDKAKLAGELGIDLIYVMKVSEQLVHMSAEDFIANFLNSADTVVAGHDFRFGYKNTGDITLLTKNKNFTTVVVPEITYHNKKISSSSIRDILSEGDIHLANFLLGRPYKIKGKVIAGNKVARSFGFPTANITHEPYLLPKAGVYYTKVKYKDKTYDGATNIGFKPTYGHNDITVETYIFDFHEDLYDQSLEIEFHKFLRPEEKYVSEAALIEQIKKDIEAVKTIIGLEKTNEKNQ